LTPQTFAGLAPNRGAAVPGAGLGKGGSRVHGYQMGAGTVAALTNAGPKPLNLLLE